MGGGQALREKLIMITIVIDMVISAFVIIVFSLISVMIINTTCDKSGDRMLVCKISLGNAILRQSVKLPRCKMMP